MLKSIIGNALTSGDWLMPIGFKLDNIEFSTSGLQNIPRHAALLGEIVTSFSLIEGVVGVIYGMLKHQQIEQSIEELKQLPSNHARVQAVRKLIAQSSVLSRDSSSDDLMKQVLGYAERRNKVAHGLWGATPSDSDVAYRLPLKPWISTIARIVSTSTSGTFLENIDRLKDEMESYGVAELADLKQEGEALLTKVFALFNSLAMANAKADKWVESTTQPIGRAGGA